MAADEFDLIARLAAALPAPRADVRLGIGDDAALLEAPAGHWLVSCVDTLVEGVHFLPDCRPEDLGWKALAVNLSDLAAMGAEPAWTTLSLTLPRADPDWLDAFMAGFVELAGPQGLSLVGGDTTRGPLSIGVQLIGLVPAGQALRRTGAAVDDQIWVTGTLGDAACALASLRQGGAASSSRLAPLLGRLNRPEPRLAAGRALRRLATAAIDVSDGLLADLGHLCRASGLGAQIWLDRLPTSAALAAVIAPAGRWDLQLAGGDDYELCFTAPTEAHAAVAEALAACATPATVIGVITERPGIEVFDPEGRPYRSKRAGWTHFADAQA